jgi:hypothetical protein
MVGKTASEIFNQSDDDFLNGPMPVGGETVETKQEDDPSLVQGEETPIVQADGAEKTAEVVDSGTEEPKKEDKPVTEEGDKTSLAGDIEGKSGDEPATKQNGDVVDKATPETKAEGSEEKQEETTPPDYEAFYNKIMTPFKANGRKIELRDPEEAIRLMQMGANYTRSMQQLAPQRKILTMLQNNNLLDEAKLSYLIDLDKKNPDAIKQLVKDSGIDPLDINTEDKTTYTPGNHSVSDAELKFNSTLDEVASTPEGQQTVQVINTTWDQESKEALWKSPEIMSIIDSQRQSGVYDRIVSEIERQKTLGTIPASTPFLAAYKHVGDQFVAATTKQTPESTQQPALQQQPVATRVASPKPAATNDDKVRAAAATKAAPAKTQIKVNPLAMSDDEFLNSMKNRI